jgi:hypothetical protein
VVRAAEGALVYTASLKQALAGKKSALLELVRA